MRLYARDIRLSQGRTCRHYTVITNAFSGVMGPPYLTTILQHHAGDMIFSYAIKPRRDDRDEDKVFIRQSELRFTHTMAVLDQYAEAGLQLRLSDIRHRHAIGRARARAWPLPF